MLLRNFLQVPGLLLSLIISFCYHYPRLISAYNPKYPQVYALIIALIFMLSFTLAYWIKLARGWQICLCLVAMILLLQSSLWLFIGTIILSAGLLAQALRADGFSLGYSVILSLLFGICLSYLCWQSADFQSLNIIVLLILLIKLLLKSN